MKVLYLTNIPSPYRVDFFNVLGKYVDLTVLFEKKASDERDLSWTNYTFNNFNGVFLKGKSISTDAAICPGVKRYVLDRSFDWIICSNFTTPTGIIAICTMKIHHIKYFLEADGGFYKNGKGLKEKLKSLIISGAKGYFSSSKSCDEYYMYYGAKKDRIFKYPFTSLYAADILSSVISEEEKKKYRDKLGISEKHVVLSVGQFIHRKGFDLLIKAAKQIDVDIGIYIVGGEPTEEYLDLKQSLFLPNVKFVGFKEKAALKEYYLATDVFVLPTREDIWGLVINEAMAYGLPIITTEKCIAGLELVDSSNGVLIPTESVKELADSINKMFESDSYREQKGWSSLKKIRGYTFEQMASEHIKILQEER